MEVLLPSCVLPGLALCVRGGVRYSQLSIPMSCTGKRRIFVTAPIIGTYVVAGLLVTWALWILLHLTQIPHLLPGEMWHTDFGEWETFMRQDEEAVAIWQLITAAVCIRIAFGLQYAGRRDARLRQKIIDAGGNPGD